MDRSVKIPGTTPCGAIALAAIAAEARALKAKDHDATWSHLIRVIFKIDTPEGKVAFVASWVALTAWFLPHILKGKTVHE